MKYQLLLLVFLSCFIAGKAQNISEVLKTEFTDEVLEQKVTDVQNKEVSMKQVLNKHEGKIVILEFWAGWCRDCLAGMEASHALKKKNPEVDFIYLSLDRTEDTWKKGITKFNLEGNNYWFSSGWKNEFNTYVDLNWIPRFVIVDQQGKIAKYYSVSATDPEMQDVIDSLGK